MIKNFFKIIIISALLNLQITLAKTKSFYLNLKDVPLKDFIYTVSKTLKININIPENLNGKITYVSNSPLTKEEIFLIFMNLLKDRNLVLKKVGKNSYLITYRRDVGFYPRHEFLIFNFENKKLANMFYQIVKNFLSSDERGKVIYNMVILYVEDSKKDFIKKIYENILKKKDNIKDYKFFVLDVNELKVDLLKKLAEKYFSQFDKENYFIGYDKRHSLLFLYAPKKYGEKFISFLKQIKEEIKNNIKNRNKYDYYVIKLKYIKAKDVENTLKRVFKKNIIISSIPFSNSLLIYASFEAKNKIEKIINSIDKEKKLVAIETQIVEFYLNKGKNFSFEANFEKSLGGANKLVFGWLFGNSDSLTITPAPGINFGILDINSNILKALLNAYKSQGIATILSNPTLLTLSGKKAVIEISRVIPFQTGQKYDSNGNPIITYEYKDVGLRLEIIPYVKDKNYILLKIKQDVSDVTGYATSQTLPITTKRSIDTEILVKSGQTIVIGGIKSKKVLVKEDKIPLLSDIPIFGTFFKRERKNYEDTNLIIFLTPKILKNENDVEKYTLDKKKEFDINSVEDKKIKR